MMYVMIAMRVRKSMHVRDTDMWIGKKMDIREHPMWIS